MKVIGSLFALGYVATADLCPTAPEILLVQDSSSSLKPTISALNSHLRQQLKDWTKTFPSPVKIGYSSFTDKPIPYAGWGGYNAFNGVDYDGCYFRGSPLTTDLGKIDPVLRNGGDYPEAHFDALVSALTDPEVGFTPGNILYNSKMEKITRIAVLITDEAPHDVGDAKMGVDGFNGKRSNSQNPDDGRGFGGGACWLGHGVPYQGIPGFDFLDSKYSAKEYVKLNDIYTKIDKNKTLTEEEVKLKEELDFRFGPPHWDDEILPHPGTFINEFDCKHYEYASIQQVKKALEDAGVYLVILVTSNSAAKNVSPTAKNWCLQNVPGFDEDASKVPKGRIPCFEGYWKHLVEEAGLDAMVVTYENPKTVVQVIADSVEKVAGVSCDATTSSTTKGPVPPPVVTTTPSTNGGDDNGNDDNNNGGADGDTTTTEIIAGGDEGHSSKTGIIAGAAGGAVAGAAVVAGILYKRFGAGAFRKTTPSVDTVEQVESPDVQMEREGLEEVTMDMFQ